MPYIVAAINLSHQQQYLQFFLVSFSKQWQCRSQAGRSFVYPLNRRIRMVAPREHSLLTTVATVRSKLHTEWIATLWTCLGIVRALLQSPSITPQLVRTS